MASATRCFSALATRLGAGVLLAAAVVTASTAWAQDAVQAGRRIYEEGVLSGGANLTGQRLDGTVAAGRAAACTNCHRPSGMGMVEGDLQVAPIAGRFLFPPTGERPLATMDPRYGKRMNIKREPHTDQSLAQAVRNGKGSNGQPLSPLMPRYDLNDADMAALTAYLRQLSVMPSPGVEDRTIRFATVITPGIEPMRKQVMLDMLRTVVMQKNGSTVTTNTSRRHMVTAAELVLGTENKWALDVWELTGAPETWAEQLKTYNKLAPPFALISGLTNGAWAPVEDFCENEHVPCWFPSVPAPPVRASQPKYSFYFSRGLPLEAEVLARQVEASRRTGRVVQLVRGNDASLVAASVLASRLRASPGTPESQVVDLNQWPQAAWPERLEQALGTLGPSDTLVMWLRPADLRGVAPVVASSRAVTYASGTLLSATSSFMPETLRKNVRLVYPYEMPKARENNVAYMHIWLKLRRIPVVDEALQSEIYFAVNLLTDTLAEMLDNLYRDYMLERAESMISQRETRKAEDEMRDRNLLRPRVKRTPMDASIPQPAYGPGYAEHANGLREGTTIYPRLTLGPGQRYASKGAYIARFDTSDLTSSNIEAESPWIVP